MFSSLKVLVGHTLTHLLELSSGGTANAVLALDRCRPKPVSQGWRTVTLTVRPWCLMARAEKAETVMETQTCRTRRTIRTPNDPYSDTYDTAHGKICCSTMAASSRPEQLTSSSEIFHRQSLLSDAEGVTFPHVSSLQNSLAGR